jgi:hypothetical protein
MKLATPLMPKRPTGDRRQDATLEKPAATYPEYNRSKNSTKKPRLSRTTNSHIVCVAGSWSSLAEIVPAETGKDCLEISINLSPVYGPLVLPLFVFYAYPVFWQRNRTSHAAARRLP